MAAAFRRWWVGGWSDGLILQYELIDPFRIDQEFAPFLNKKEDRLTLLNILPDNLIDQGRHARVSKIHPNNPMTESRIKWIKKQGACI